MKVKVYGQNHSPWGQAVLLALHEKGIEHTLYQLPPLEAFKQWGVFMPAVSIDGNPWEIESSQILVKLGFEPISDKDLRAVKYAFQGVLHRLDKPFHYFAAFARDGDTSSPLVNRSVINFVRSFIVFYMFTMINLYKWKLKPEDPENFGDQYLFWERTLKSSTGPFLDGDTPGTRDFMLFGVIQCHASVPVPALEPLRSDERLAGLRQWLANMHERFGGYPQLHSGCYFKPYRPEPVPTSLPQRAIFYLGLTTMFVAFPLTLPLTLVLMRKPPR